MKVPAIIIAAAATLALAAPGGYAANARLAPEPGPAPTKASLVSLHKTKKPKAGSILANKGGKGKVVTGKGKTRGSLPPIIVITSPSRVPAPLVSDCQSSMVGCTPEEECTYWGSNCILVEHPSLPAVLSESSTASSEENAQSSSEQSNLSSEVASAASSASDSAGSTVASTANPIENWDDCE